jgi:hypothetical protein
VFCSILYLMFLLCATFINKKISLITYSKIFKNFHVTFHDSLIIKYLKICSNILLFHLLIITHYFNVKKTYSFIQLKQYHKKKKVIQKIMSKLLLKLNFISYSFTKQIVFINIKIYLKLSL